MGCGPKPLDYEMTVFPPIEVEAQLGARILTHYKHSSTIFGYEVFSGVPWCSRVFLTRSFLAPQRPADPTSSQVNSSAVASAASAAVSSPGCPGSPQSPRLGATPVDARPNGMGWGSYTYCYKYASYTHTHIYIYICIYIYVYIYIWICNQTTTCKNALLFGLWVLVL